MIAMTTKSSTSVNPSTRFHFRYLLRDPQSILCLLLIETERVRSEERTFHDTHQLARDKRGVADEESVKRILKSLHTPANFRRSASMLPSRATSSALAASRFASCSGGV